MMAVTVRIKKFDADQDSPASQGAGVGSGQEFPSLAYNRAEIRRDMHQPPCPNSHAKLRYPRYPRVLSSVLRISALQPVKTFLIAGCVEDRIAIMGMVRLLASRCDSWLDGLK